MPDHTDASPPPAPSKVTRARAVTVGAAEPGKPRRRAVAVMPDEPVATLPIVVTPADASAGAPATPATLSVQQGGIGNVTAGAVDVQQGGIGIADATDIAVSQGGIGVARGERVSVEMGAIALSLGEQARVSQGYVNTIIARDAAFEQGMVGTIVAADVEVRGPSFVGILLAQRVEGDVRALLDWRGALVGGAVLGIVLGLLRRR